MPCSVLHFCHEIVDSIELDRKHGGHFRCFSTDREPVWFLFTNQVLRILTKNSLVWNLELWPERTRCKMDPNWNRDNIGVMSGRVLNPQKQIKKQNGAHSNPEGGSHARKSCLPT